MTQAQSFGSPQEYVKKLANLNSNPNARLPCDVFNTKKDNLER